jgi:hypothetical protein
MIQNELIKKSHRNHPQISKNNKNVVTHTRICVCIITRPHNVVSLYPVAVGIRIHFQLFTEERC